MGNDKWGSVLAGETSIEGAIREAKEEVGLDLRNCKHQFITVLKRPHTLNHIWLFEKEFPLTDVVLQKEEVEEVKLVTIEEIRKILEDGSFIQVCNNYFEELASKIEERC